MSKPIIEVDPAAFQCCAKPQIEVMDYMRYTPDDWQNPSPRINRVCIKCWTHWYGTATRIRRFTRATWDAFLRAAFIDNRVEGR